MSAYIDTVTKMLSTKSSFQLLIKSLNIFRPTKEHALTIGFISIISIVCGMFLGFSAKTVDLSKDILSYFIEIDIALLGIIFTGYVFFQVLVNKELLKRLLSENNHKTDESKLQESNEYFVQVMILYVLFIFLCIIIKILLSTVNNSFVLFRCNMLNNILASSLLIIFIYYELFIIWEVKSFIFNIFQIFNGYTATQIIESIQDESNNADE